MDYIMINSTEHLFASTALILDLAVEHNIVNKAGAWYAYKGDKIGQGRENAKLYLSEHEDVCNEIEALVLEKVGIGNTDSKQEENKEE